MLLVCGCSVRLLGFCGMRCVDLHFLGVDAGGCVIDLMFSLL